MCSNRTLKWDCGAAFFESKRTCRNGNAAANNIQAMQDSHFSRENTLCRVAANFHLLHNSNEHSGSLRSSDIDQPIVGI